MYCSWDTQLTPVSATCPYVRITTLSAKGLLSPPAHITACTHTQLHRRPLDALPQLRPIDVTLVVTLVMTLVMTLILTLVLTLVVTLVLTLVLTLVVTLTLTLALQPASRLRQAQLLSARCDAWLASLCLPLAVT